MGAVGTEHPSIPAGNAGGGDSGGSKSGNNGASFGTPTPPATPPKPTDPDLAEVVAALEAAWPNVPPAMRPTFGAGIVAMVKAAGGAGVAT